MWCRNIHWCYILRITRVGSSEQFSFQAWILCKTLILQLLLDWAAAHWQSCLRKGLPTAWEWRREDCFRKDHARSLGSGFSLKWNFFKERVFWWKKTHSNLQRGITAGKHLFFWTCPLTGTCEITTSERQYVYLLGLPISLTPILKSQATSTLCCNLLQLLHRCTTQLHTRHHCQS